MQGPPINSIRNPYLIGRQLTVYLERFAYFFSSEFLIRSAFETLNSEVKPEHAGFRAACRTLFTAYAQEFGLDAEGEPPPHGAARGIAAARVQ